MKIAKPRDHHGQWLPVIPLKHQHKKTPKCQTLNKQHLDLKDHSQV